MKEERILSYKMSQKLTEDDLGDVSGGSMLMTELPGSHDISFDY